MRRWTSTLRDRAPYSRSISRRGLEPVPWQQEEIRAVSMMTPFYDVTIPQRIGKRVSSFLLYYPLVH